MYRLTLNMPILFAYREDRFGFRFEVGESAVLGRSPECDLILFDRATSRQHAEILRTDQGYILKDLGSTNGTMHNESRVNGQVKLNRNDEIRIGQEVFLFDPSLDVAVGREGAVLIVGEINEPPEGVMTSPSEVDISALDRAFLAPLFQVAIALANRPNKGRVLKQSVYAIGKIFQATRMALLWPETIEAQRLTALLVRSQNTRLALPRPLVDLAIQENQSVIWPRALMRVEFTKGERLLTEIPRSSMTVPLKAHGTLQGLIYVESETRSYTTKDLSLIHI